MRILPTLFGLGKAVKHAAEEMEHVAENAAVDMKRKSAMVSAVSVARKTSCGRLRCVFACPCSADSLAMGGAFGSLKIRRVRQRQKKQNAIVQFIVFQT